MATEPGSGALPDLDLRGVPAADRHPRIDEAFAALPLDDAFVLINDHDPVTLRKQLDRDHAGSFAWEYLSTEPDAWRIRVTRIASSPLPRVLLDTEELESRLGDAGVGGAVWRLEPSARELDANLISLPPEGTIGEHVGADLDTLWHVVAGSGVLRTERGDVALAPGGVVYLPRRARRAVLAGPDGLRYLSVHRRKQTRALSPTFGAGE